MMSNLTAACSALPRAPRLPQPSSRRHRAPGLIPVLAATLRGVWLHWRRHAILKVLRRVDDRLLRDAGIEPCEVEAVVDGVLARWR